MKKLLLCVSTAFLAMLAGCSEGIGGGDFLTNLSGNNKIYYTTTDGKKVVLSGNFDSILISNTYKNGKGCLTFDEEVTIIGESAFYDCENLLSIEIPDCVTSIGDHAFMYCSSLTSITIPASVTSIGASAFIDCFSLTCFYGKFASEDSRCLIIDGTLDSFAPAGLTEYTIPDSVTQIGDHAFMYCSSLTSITIPDSVTSIGEGAFALCSSLTKVYCKPTTPPTGEYGMFNVINALERKIYVPTESVDAYKNAPYWDDFKSCIYGYDF